MKNIIQFSINSRLLILVLGIITLIAGLFSYKKLPVDAFPDVTPALVQVFVETEGLAPEEVEKYVTYPIETAMNGLPDIKEIRSISNFGLSVVNIYFKDKTDIYFARQLVGERLQLAREEIPEGFGEPEMGPIATGLGQILFYFVEDETNTRSDEEMREIQDWLIKFNLQTVPGVTEVLSLGGQVKQYQIQIRPEELLRYGLELHDVVQAVQSNNSNVGAQFIVKNSEEYIVRSVGLAKKISDLENIVLKALDGTPILLKQVADVVVGGEIRRGLATMNGKGEAVVGMVLKLIGTNTSEVIHAVKERMDKINKVLPPGIKVVPYYDQATLVAKCIRTVTNALNSGILLVVIILFIFMGGIRPSIVVAVSIPFSILFAFILMKSIGISANLMSLGGLAIAIGMMVDGTIVMVENIDRILKERKKDQTLTQSIIEACSEVARPIIFSISIIIIVFLPIMSLQGVEGKIFSPLAYTVSLAMLGSLIFAVFLAPVLTSFLMKKVSVNHHDRSNWIMTSIIKIYQPFLHIFIKKRSLSIILSVGLLILGFLVFPRLGSEFVPRLDEGDLLVRATMAPSISLDEARNTVLVFEKQLFEKFSEVERVVSRVGRGEVGAHADPVNNAEVFVRLKPRSEWKNAKTSNELYKQMSEAFENFPGVQFNFTQPIAAAVDELLTGTKAELAIKIFGDNLDILKLKSEQIEQLIKSVPGASDVQKDQITGTPQLHIKINRDSIARYGVNVENVQETIQSAIGGEKAGQLFEGIRRFDILVRYTPNARHNKEAIENLLITNSDGVKIPLIELVDIKEIVGPRQITRQNNQRFITVQCNVRGRDIGSFVQDAKKLFDKNLNLPPGYFIEWGGQFQLQQEANKRLAIVIPITLIVVFLLLFSNFNSIKNSLLILLNIPLALVGGVFALFISGQNLSVPASVGFIALFGIALENGMVLVTYLNQLYFKDNNVDNISIQGALQRLRPVIMTALTTALGLLPLLFSSGTGSEVQRPLATVVIGGLVTSTILTLLVIPSLYKWFAIDRKE